MKVGLTYNIPSSYVKTQRENLVGPMKRRARLTAPEQRKVDRRRELAKKRYAAKKNAVLAKKNLIRSAGSSSLLVFAVRTEVKMSIPTADCGLFGKISTLSMYNN